DHVDVDLSTVGWSGNEEIMGVVTATFFHLLWWRTIHRGGHYTYSVPVELYDNTLDLGALGRARGPADDVTVPRVGTP
ncbi:MAG TPA: hypothetical protein VFE45_02875, partial [Coriobacteriia bacterium]|nr:hypothetical protein [Coriobacteriia bacterium]